MRNTRRKQMEELLLRLLESEERKSRVVILRPRGKPPPDPLRDLVETLATLPQ